MCASPLNDMATYRSRLCRYSAAIARNLVDKLEAIRLFKASGAQYWYRWLDCCRALEKLGQMGDAAELCRLHIGTLL